MKYHHLSLIILSLFFVACKPDLDHVIVASVTSPVIQTPSPSVTPTKPPTPTLIPCGPAITHPITSYPQYTIYYDGCTLRDSDVIEKAFTWGIESIPTNINLSEINLYVFDNNIEGLADVENASKKSSGFSTNTLDQVKKSWGAGGGQSYLDGTITIYYGEMWRTEAEAEQIHTIVHELLHQVQYRASGVKNFNNAHVPVWWVEGTAQYYSGVIVTQHGLTLTYDGMLHSCHHSLAELSDWATLDPNCIYSQAAEAAHLLDQLYGEEKYLELLGALKNYSFSEGFQRIYSIKLEDFDQLFQQYIKDGYKKIPNLASATAKP